MPEIKPRYEFRVWSDALARVREKLEDMVQPKQSMSQEIYLISAATDNCNAKIRAALMDVKVLVAETRGLEQWKPILKASFPLENSVIASEVFPSLKLPQPSLQKATYDLDAFLDMMAQSDGISIVEVHKTRHQFDVRECVAEYAQTTLNGVRRDTVAVESIDPDAVLQLVRELGISQANVSYVREIKQVLDWMPHELAFDGPKGK